MSLTGKSLCISLVLLVVSACATEEDIVPLLYTPSESVIPIIQGSKAIKLEVADNRGVYSGKIGAKVNGYGQEMAAIRTTVPIRQIVLSAFTEELSRRNLNVDDTQSRKLEVSVTALHNNFKTGFASGAARGIAVFRVRVVGANGGVLYDRLTAKIHEDDDVTFALGEAAAGSVGNALDKAMKDLFDNPQFNDALARS